LQAAAGLALDRTAGSPMLPFAVAEVQVFGRCPPSLWAWVRGAGSGLDIDLCDDAGAVLVRLKGLVSRSQGGGSAETVLCRPVWEPCAPAAGPVPARREVVRVDGEVGGGRFEAEASALFERVRALMAEPGEVLLQVAVPQGSAWAGLAGLLKTAHLERPRFHGQLVEVDDNVQAHLDEAARRPDDAHLRWIDGIPHTAAWRDCPAGASARWREDGVYLITGGAGGLGLLFAEDIGRRCPRATLVLAGRSEPSEPARQRIERMGAEYHRVDLTDAATVARLVADVVARRGALHGVLHAAGIVRDGIILNKPAGTFAAVLAPKVAGALNLDAATAGLDLDFLALFSSGAGAWGNAGQADYATANAFLDAFAEARERAGRRTLSVTWPLWKDGGMGVDRATEDRMTATLGAVPLETQAGLRAFDAALGSGLARVAVMQGDRARLRAAGFGGSEAQVPMPAPNAPDPHTPIRDHLVGLLCRTLGVEPGDLADDEPLSAFGLDSIMVLEINNRLEETYPDLPQTLFFEYGTLGALVDYFATHHRSAVRRPEPVPAPEPSPAAVPAPSLDDLIAEMEAQAPDPLAFDPLADRRAHSPFHSVAPLPSPLPGFSLSRSLVAPQICTAVLRQVAQRQAELRRVLFAGLALERAGRVVDLGCGIGADVIELASAVPGLDACGLTVSAEDAVAARALVAARGLETRVQIVEEDNGRYGFPPGCGLVFSIQTLHFVADKPALFARVNAALAEDGRLALADWVATGLEPVRDAALGSAVDTRAQLASALAAAGLAIEWVVDASAEVAAFLHDPELETEVAGLSPDTARTVRKLVQQGAALAAGRVRFCLVRARKDASASALVNIASLLDPRPYVEALAAVPPSPAYGDVLARFPEFLAGGAR
jgi:SAM-dependent methyltransferase/NADP-dependent 3-hydroxy acid dehydrogenase YdfG/acyl carrier protein